MTTEGHKTLERRMIAIARWLKHRYHYTGSKETLDFVSRGFEKLAGSALADKMRDQPEELLPLSGRLMRQVMLDELRCSRALRRRANRKATLNENLIGSDPSLERRIDDARRFALVDRVLEQIERGELPFRFSKRKLMVSAFRLKFKGQSEAAIAGELGIGKGTAHNWIKHVTAFLTRQVAKRELADEQPQ
jgi:hypothetical protein